jgi:hypothetical protein
MAKAAKRTDRPAAVPPDTNKIAARRTDTGRRISYHSRYIKSDGSDSTATGGTPQSSILNEPASTRF